MPRWPRSKYARALAGTWPGELAPGARRCAAMSIRPAAPSVPGWCLRNELEPNIRGYTAQVCQPALVGRAIPTEAQELFDLGDQAFELACRLMRPGTPWREVWTQVQALSTPTHKVEFLMHGRGL